ncbi:MAG: AtpZ/AtpI family protein [Planctomycetes bacterium]|nr:AtpZ/AtpI family protein [Planctomycetota bacterium]
MPVPTRDFARLSSMGVEFTLTVGLFGWIGYAVDTRWAVFGSFPGFLLLGVFVGMGLGVYRLNYQLAAWQKSYDTASGEAEPEDRGSDPPDR